MFSVLKSSIIQSSVDIIRPAITPVHCTVGQDNPLIQGIVDGSASKPALRQHTGYMIEKTYHDIAPYLGAFGAYLIPH